MKYTVKGIKTSEEHGSDNLWHEYEVEENVSIVGRYGNTGTDPVLLALVTATASKMLETNERVQVLFTRDEETEVVLYEMKKS